MEVVAKMDLELHQLDVKTAFLNGELKEEIYMMQPDSFQIQGNEDKAYTLKKSLYGLKQSSRQWYLKFHQTILEMGYVVSPLDHCVYIWKNDDKLAILSLYVFILFVLHVYQAKDLFCIELALFFCVTRC